MLLLDESFGALDAFTRSHLQEALLDIWREHRTTMLFVTHDIDKALYVSDRVVIMETHPGRIKSIVKVGLSMPRERTSTAFQHMRTSILHLLENRESEDEDWRI